MENYDAIVVGAGITGAAIAYELQNQGQRVLLLEKHRQPVNATTFSYGGIIYWAGTTPLQRQLCHESRYRWTHLSQELGGETEYRELELLLYLRPEDDPRALAQQFNHCLIRPQQVDRLTAIAIEPQLNPDGIGGAFVVPQGHVHGGKTVNAYLQAFLRLGGIVRIAEVEGLITKRNRVQGVHSGEGNFFAHKVILASGGQSRTLLTSQGVNLPLYFTHAALLQTAPTKENLRCVIMPADLQQRPNLEALAPTLDWHHPNDHCVATVLEPGAVQFFDGRLFIGQISQLVTSPHYRPDLAWAQQQLQTAIANILPRIARLPLTAHHCLVAFSGKPLPLVGEIPHLSGLVLFTGFTHPLVYVPPLAQKLAQHLTIGREWVIDHLAAQLNSLQTEK
ncbi:MULTISPECIES: FAD-binding oxidoreductase [unclassified Synechocystis]|uniref:NAD(P)/FAD-dependent oxidoreductase n=1 Tax=unclassified Synechocystis TaxID=2640012 RepID=UPI000419F964|nr:MULTISPECIES: FAD-binding oxidoreductase [unclassified Synechocystis]AIE73457.1 FAD dependent oxidoreductase [Synechocystis sp. PCC 6714]MCT0254186.1 FAD-binding oxidoreductase [Synechocystis sp. CS-94]